MKERPILFSAPMVRAILEDRKTQTRRVVKARHFPKLERFLGGALDGKWNLIPLPYGQPGDRLWVRETWSDANSDDGPCVLYRADYDRRYLVQESYPVDYAKYPGADFGQWASDVESGAEGRWRSSIHMPRWASRITLEITDVRAQRVQDINEEDALAEGVPYSSALMPGGYRGAFHGLWDSINESRGFGWAANPYVWVITFKRLKEST